MSEDASSRDDDSRPTPVRQGGVAPASEGDEDRGDVPRPTPVRQAMEAARESVEPVEPPSLEFEIEGEPWIVRVEGRTTSGAPEDAGAPLLFLTFARAEAPDEPVRETLAALRSLRDIEPARLASLFARARPHASDWAAGEFFPGTRKERKRRR